MRGLGITVTAIAAMVATACTPEAVSPAATTTSATATKMTNYLDGLVRARQFRGAVEVRVGDKVLLSKGFDRADVDRDAPNGPDTRYRIASLTKQFTALAVLILQEQGKLAVTDLVCAHLPNCPETWRAITVEHLLTHTAGLFDYTEVTAAEVERNLAEFGPEPTPEQIIHTFIDRPLDFSPGTQWKYSSSGYTVLGQLIEQLSGHTYGQFMKDEIFDPLDMSDTAYQPDQRDDDHDAVGYQNWTTPATTLADATAFSSGGMYSTVTDLARWNQFLLTGTPALVKPDTLAQLLRPRVDADATGRYGYGLFTLGTGDAAIHFHGGWLAGFSTYNEIRPATTLSIVVLSNLDTADTMGVGRDLATLANP